jgi:hypothetical protein
MGTMLRSIRRGTTALSSTRVALFALAGHLAWPAAVRAQHPDTACARVLVVGHPHEYDSARVARSRRCTYSVDSTRRTNPRARVEREVRRVGEIPWTIPEYHDEQRLPDGAGGLGPLALIYASPNLAEFTDTTQILEHGARGFMAALVVVEVLPGEVLPPTYVSLGLEKGVNCIWLSFTPGVTLPKRWGAKVSHPGDNAPCAHADGTVLGPTSPAALSVIPSKEVGSRFADYPSVARFSEASVPGGAANTVPGQPLLGVKCLDAWCEIGPQGFSPRSPRFVSGWRETRIKGWHDEQWLAIRAGGAFRPRLRASLVPFPGVDSLRESHFSAGWVRVALIVFHDSPVGTKYYDWGLRAGPNVLALKFDGVRWAAQVIAPGSTTPVPWTWVKRYKHYDAAVPKTVRWRWTIADDGVWVPCGQGCCETDGGGGFASSGAGGARVREAGGAGRF